MISVIINYCSNERMFLDANIIQCKKFSNDIIISYGSHLYDGTPEDFHDIEYFKNKYPSINFVKYNVDINTDLTKQKGVINRPTAYWHNLARWTAIKEIKNKDWVFIIDIDEIPDGDRVKEWLNIFPLKKEECYKLANYWYFKSPENQATTLEDSVLLINYNYLTENNIFGDWERDSLILSSGTLLRRQIKGIDNKPMFHHYSFCRTKEGLKHKLRNWGHCNEYNNVDKIIEYIYTSDQIRDIIHNYNYITVPNKFNIEI